MPESPERIIELIKSQLKGDISTAQAEELAQWMQNDPANRTLVEDFFDKDKLEKGISETYAIYHKVWERLEKQLPQGSNWVGANVKKKPYLFRLYKYAAVAAAVLIFGAVGIYFYANQNKRQTSIAAHEKDILAPVTNRATITLSDGSQVSLNKAADGALALQGNIKVVKLANGQVAYQTIDGQLLNELQYNTLTNPRGSKVVDIVLSDGSRIWLNAGSSITYPVVFLGNERKVELNGEAYFEVAKDPYKKFIVNAKDATTEVLGTHFNVNAYADQAETKITLLEGSVKVSAPTTQQSSLLKPGQQAAVNKVQSTIKLSRPNPDQIIAWKNGFFTFSGLGFEQVMENIGRWYDVRIVFASDVPDIRLEGDLGQNTSLNSALEALRFQGAKVRLVDKTVIVD